MRIDGYFEPEFKPKAPFIDAIVISKEVGFYHKIRFLIDTGASMTILLDKDVRDTGLDVRKLKRAKRQVSGVGGGIDTYLMEEAKIVFKTRKGFYEEKLTVFIGVHNLSNIDEEGRRKILVMPSLLGREILDKFDLHCLPQKGEVYIEK
ncbi:retroviral-like aspartic protease family protein [bacterium]|nr:retroviral-like aspartic protease family protein [bacterium]MBU1613739.1 retroviral-like aspartic protease family protein [bacterium]